MLKDKRVLITAGPTWVPIDKVRVISNTATGETGIVLSEQLIKLGFKVTLLLGPSCAYCINKKIKVLRFSYFNELNKLMEKELRKNKYDFVIHSAAVSDYRPERFLHTKVKSGLKGLRLKLIPTPKIIDRLKIISPSSKVVGFKYEPEAKKFELIKKARALINRANLEFVVSNSVRNGHYLAYVVNRKASFGPFINKRLLSNKLIDLISVLD